MSMSEMVSTGALVLMVAILLVLLHQCLRLRDLWHMALGCQKMRAGRGSRKWKTANCVLRCGPRKNTFSSCKESW